MRACVQEVKYHQWLESLQHMLEHYYEVIEQLSPIERELMAKKLSELESCLHAGFHILNWNSLGILEFIQACRRAINTFQQVVKQVQKNSGIIEQVGGLLKGAGMYLGLRNAYDRQLQNVLKDGCAWTAATRCF